MQPIRERLRARFGLVDGMVPGGGPARYLVSPDRRLQIGFITPISQHFCETCNRVRLSVDGMLHLCLGQDTAVDFRTLLRTGCSDEEIAQRIGQALLARPARHEFRELPGRSVLHHVIHRRLMHRAAAPDSNELPQWRRHGGLPVSGQDRIILDKNYQELWQVAQGALEDGVLMGCGEAQMREVLHRLVDALINPYGERGQA